MASTDYRRLRRRMRRLNRLRLLISPRLGEIDENKVVSTFIGLLKRLRAVPNHGPSQDGDGIRRGM